MTEIAPVETMTMVQVADELGYDPALVSKMMREGKGPGIPVGERRFVILRSWFEDWKKTLPMNWSQPIVPLDPTDDPHAITSDSV